ncbi:chorismate mutase [Nesterenkonia sp. LB17]|uniref:chorismate mutase n=1 Tax=unclassified Nesterenkonia TaxID=2629769 RepID=UPI001F4CF1FD|nr:MULTISPECIES: chorismate mutase [unclassified Nesterenkonia]MCH8559831.1 chorismate mutase [Nesterenkonia sp. DZ6]MCH8561995.1 chorismate mutase [Nesterenkonia sp. YGD6]MCH8564468.1 chorismate mutase [Nesterenkonia sp. LB17]
MSTDPRAGEAAAQVEPEILDELLSMRASIDNIDATLVYLLAERFKATQRVGVLKAKHQLPAADPAREKNQIARLKRLANEAQLDPEFAEKFLNFIIEEVIRHHEAISASSGATGGPGPSPTDPASSGAVTEPAPAAAPADDSARR